jgi:phosphate starvation-inducible protein PhoH and related proteins
MARKNKSHRQQNTKRLSKFDKVRLEHISMEFEDRAARKDGPQVKKSWSEHDFKNLKPLNQNQASMIESYFTGNNIIASGSAGTGKTYLALWLATQSVFGGQPQKEIIIVRSAVPSRDIGFLPGDEKEKLAPYEAVYRDSLADLAGRKSTYDDMVEAGFVKFMPTSFLRGLTWDNAIIIVDEVQNLTFEEIHTVMTRVGKNSRIIVCGDIAQNDFANNTKEDSGFDKFVRVSSRMKGFDRIHYTKHDIVRSGFVKSWIIALEDEDGSSLS